VTLALAGEALALGGLATTAVEGAALAERAWVDGRAADRFARMVAALGGPPDVLRDARLVAAPARCPVIAPVSGVLTALDTRAVGLAVQALGGGRHRGGEAIDPRVGVGDARPLGQRIEAGEPLAVVHAADADTAASVASRLAHAWVIVPSEAGTDTGDGADPVLERVFAVDDLGGIGEGGAR